MKIKTIKDAEYDLNKIQFNYQPVLTEKLDLINSDFNQETINEIILWKVNRYANISEETLKLLNSIKVSVNALDVELTRSILENLIKINGIGLPMATTILRFKNPNIYQIIDQRVFRIIYGKELKLSQSKSLKQVNLNIDIYLKYLEDLSETCRDLKIPFNQGDRILYSLDKEVNSEIKLKY